MLWRSPDVLPTNRAFLEGEPEEDPGARGPISKVRGKAAQSPAWTAGFVSKSNSYKAWIGSEEAKQTRLKSEGDQDSG